MTQRPRDLESQHTEEPQGHASNHCSCQFEMKLGFDHRGLLMHCRCLSEFPDDVNPATKEKGGPRGPEPTRYGDWERKGRCVDF